MRWVGAAADPGLSRVGQKMPGRQVLPSRDGYPRELSSRSSGELLALRDAMKKTLLWMVVLVACAERDTMETNETALSDDQCNHFAIEGKTTICHRAGDRIVKLR